uniref:Uncharacterized protein n=1 Tax=Anguilla anguilla TaxID=7936 RepID=A0A0E9PPL4_ANGAN
MTIKKLILMPALTNHCPGSIKQEIVDKENLLTP